MKEKQCVDCGTRFTARTPFMDDLVKVYLPGVDGALCRGCANKHKKKKAN